MSENERLLSEIEYLKKLISKQKQLSSNTADSSIQSRNSPRKQVRDVRVNVRPVPPGEADKKEEAEPSVPSFSAPNRYKWVGTSATKSQEPPKGANGRSSVGTRIDSISKDDTKNEAVQFLKAKFAKRTVHLNRHHAAFSGRDLNRSDKSTAPVGKIESKEIKADQSDVRKSAALSFLKEAGVVPNQTDGASSLPSRSSSTKPQKYSKQNLKIDRRPIETIPANVKAQTSEEHQVTKMVLKGKHKLVRTHVSVIPAKETHVKYSTGNSVIHKDVTLSNAPDSGLSKKVSKYKIVKSQTSIPPFSGIGSARAQKVTVSSSRYKLEKKEVPQAKKNDNRTPEHRTKKQSLSKYKWSNLQNNFSHKQQSSLINDTRRDFSPKLPKAINTPRSIKMKSRFKLVRKALKNTQGKLLNLDEKSPTAPRRRIKNSKYKLVNKGGGSAVSLAWRNRYSLKRNNNAVDSVNVNQLLGRKVVNLSRDKYKFVSGSQRHFMKGHVSTVPARVLERKLKYSSKSKFKLDRRVPGSPGSRRVNQPIKNTNIVMIGGILYKSSRRRLVKSGPINSDGNDKSRRKYSLRNLRKPRMRAVIVRGVKYEMDASGHTLHRVKAAGSEGNSVKRLDIGGVTYIQTRPGTLVKASTQAKRIVASRSLHKSIVRTTAPKKKTEKKYCMFYNRFGKCNRGNNCKYTHDPDKIAICTRFLRGTCSVTDCPFSHKVAKEKMPVCLHYLKGTCGRDNCPYRHVKVSKGAEICQDFLNGYCPRGDLCNKQHTTVCLEFMETGKCPREGKCKLYHPKKTKKRKLLKDSTGSSHSTESIPKKSLKLEVDVDDDRHLPLSKRHLPAYISLGSGSGDLVPVVKTANANDGKKVSLPLKIKPTFS